MVQGYYSLEKAAEVLGMPIEELNRMARSREIRAFADGGSWKFRQQDIEELKRTRQYGSDPEIQLSDSGSSILEEDDEDHVLSAERPAGDEGDSAPTVIGMRGQPRENESDVRLEVAKEASDSDVKLVPDTGSGSAPEIAIDDLVPIGDDIVGTPSDSDIRMTFEDSVVPKKSKESMDRTEEIELGTEATAEDASEVGLTPTKKSEDDAFRLDDDLDAGFRIEGESDVNLVDLGDSEFDMPPPKTKAGPKTPTPSSKAKAKAPPSEDSDSENLDLDDIRLEDDSDFILADSAQIDSISTSDSGINLSAPDDSGISLEAEGGSDSEFEVSLDTDDSDLFGSEDMPAFKDDSAPKLVGKAQKTVEEEESTEDSGASDSDFELSIDDEFEVEEESGSEVVALDDEEDEEDEDDYGDFAEEEESPRPLLEPRGKVVMAAPTNPPWPGWMIFFLGFTVVPLALCGIMMFELMRDSWSHQTPYTLDATVINQVHELAKMIGLAS